MGEQEAREEAWRVAREAELVEAMQDARIRAARDFADMMQRFRLEFADREERG